MRQADVVVGEVYAFGNPSGEMWVDPKSGAGRHSLLVPAFVTSEPVSGYAQAILANSHPGTRLAEEGSASIDEVREFLETGLEAYLSKMAELNEKLAKTDYKASAKRQELSKKLAELRRTFPAGWRYSNIRLAQAQSTWIEYETEHAVRLEEEKIKREEAKAAERAEEEARAKTDARLAELGFNENTDYEKNFFNKDRYTFTRAQLDKLIDVIAGE